MTITTILILLAVGLLAGFLSGMVGIGGGIIIVPVLVYFLGFTPMNKNHQERLNIFLQTGITKELRSVVGTC